MRLEIASHHEMAKVRLYHAVAPSVPKRCGMQRGWSETLDRLAEEVTKG
jgi:hypothetical protein